MTRRSLLAWVTALFSVRRGPRLPATAPQHVSAAAVPDDTIYWAAEYGNPDMIESLAARLALGAGGDELREFQAEVSNKAKLPPD